MAEKATLVGLLGKAVIDPKFRDELLKNRNAVADKFQLSANDRDALNKVDAAKLHEAAQNLGNRQEFTIEVAVSGHFDAKS